jgi:hypothetical protein
MNTAIVFWDVTLCSMVYVYEVSEQRSASIFRVEKKNYL